jgi:hypothetical protein
MPTHKSAKRDRLLLQQGGRQQSARKGGWSTRKSPFSAPIASSPFGGNTRNQQEHRILRILLTLLAILCIYCLGSLSLAPSLLPSTFFQNHPAASSTGITIGGGECPPAPTDLHYLPSVPGTSEKDTLPQLWFQAGYNEQDFASAITCAASFLLAYLSFDFNKAQTFVTCTAMLSVGGQQRFYGHASHRSADNRVDQLWRASIQKQQIQQSTQIRSPLLLKAQFDQKRMLAWMQIHYQLTIHRSYEVFGRDDTMTVLIVSVPHSTSHERPGWQVSDWRDGNGAFALAMPL